MARITSLRLLLLCLAASLGSNTALARTPSWLSDAMARSQPADFLAEPAVVLHDESVHDYQRKGRVMETTRYAVRVQSLEGRDHASFELPYTANSDRIREVEIWIIQPGQKPVRLRRKDCMDVALDLRGLYSELRSLRYSAATEARRDTVFAYEYVVERRSLVAEKLFHFGGDIPVLNARLEVRVPPGWSVRGHASNQRVPLRTSSNGDHSRWEASDIPALEIEEWAAGRNRRTTPLRFTIEPDTAESQHYPLLSWSSWESLAVYYDPIYRAATQPTPPIEAKARELTAGLATPAEQIAAIARFVQGVNYVSISINIDQGGGYLPRDAASTLQAYYGDCKDKSALMSSLLAAVGLNAHPLIVSAETNSYVDPEWPSPAQFNHCIVAVQLPEGVDYESQVEHPELGRLLIFDPTDPDVLPGYLDFALQNELGMLIAPVADPLIRLPLVTAENSREQYRVSARLQPNGTLTGSCQLIASGGKANRWRSDSRRLAPIAFQEGIARQLGRAMRTVRVEGAAWEDQSAKDRFSLRFDFESPAYARSMRDRLLIVQPAILERRDHVPPDEQRESDLQFPIGSRRERIEIALPAGFALDERGPAVLIERPYLRYRSEALVEDGVLVFERELDWYPHAVPAAEYPELRAALQQIVAADATPVVLARVD